MSIRTARRGAVAGARRRLAQVVDDATAPIVAFTSPVAGSTVPDRFTVQGTFVLPFEQAPVVRFTSPAAGSTVADRFTVAGTFSLDTTTPRAIVTDVGPGSAAARRTDA